MKSPLLRFVVAGLGVLLASCASEDSLTRVEVNAPSLRDSVPTGRAGTIERELFKQVNAYRQKCGLGGMQRHSGLDRLAREHAEFMLRNQGKFGLHGKTVTHYGFEERLMIARQQLGMDTIGENVIAGKPGSNAAGRLVEVWCESPRHKANLTEDWQVTGIGVAVDDQGMVCATQLFGCRAVSHSRFAGPRW